MSHTFLSDDWFTAVAQLIEENRTNSVDSPTVNLNVRVTDGPDGERELHVADGSFGAGFVEAPTTLTVPYEVAKQLFIEGNQQAAMQAFMSGQIKIEGDMTTLMSMQNRPADAAQEQLQQRIREITI